MSTEVAAEPTETGERRSQEITRERSRRRRSNIDTAEGRRIVKVRLTDAEYAKVAEAAEEASMTVPRYLGECAVNPVAPARTKSGKPRAWLTWPKRQALAALVLSATEALDMIRLQHLSKIGSNLNQLTRVANSNGVISSDEIGEVLDDVRELIDELRERATELQQLARDTTRR
ncbi:plasmid mobilization relaxosome protein MobC [Nocardia alba]|uniref:Mobilization protein MobC n=1 Tax=Nocardia alba TaxID=225051 RepID=A0A4V2P935_9NOCA|nr:plasmid mobilization relaxosome protein MobC [Nocardia alba]TCJ88095.1 mobilization protein MobC [Nocardia alba]